jgi:hypothetical protein
MYFFIYCMYSCVLVDIVTVSSEQPVEVDQEQFFEEEPQCLSKASGLRPSYSICPTKLA